jgi:hypothetical protein
MHNIKLASTKSSQAAQKWPFLQRNALEHLPKRLKVGSPRRSCHSNLKSGCSKRLSSHGRAAEGSRPGTSAILPI